jgi:hypothetical protein
MGVRAKGSSLKLVNSELVALSVTSTALSWPLFGWPSLEFAWF